LTEIFRQAAERRIVTNTHRIKQASSPALHANVAMPKAVKRWSLTSLREKLIKIGVKVISHGRWRRGERYAPGRAKQRGSAFRFHNLGFDHPLPALGAICCCPSRSKG
jgi:hypothetical protein